MSPRSPHDARSARLADPAPAHVGPNHFRVVRQPDGKRGDAVEVPSPITWRVDESSAHCLTGELRWYLERFLDYPFPPDTDRAERMRAALRLWGQDAFRRLFDSGQPAAWLSEAQRQGYAQLNLQIVGDSASVLGWPWETLTDLGGVRLAESCQLERRLNTAPDPPELSDKLPRDRVNILLVIARPLKGDVAFRSVARPLVELVHGLGLPADVTVLRPPTLEQLRAHLHERPGHYHILHFDGHGSYGSAPAPAGPHRLGAPQGQLLFEDGDGQPYPVEASRLSALLAEHGVPAVVLNACQSAMIDEKADDPFASVATALLRAGVRSVAAMSYSLYVSAAREFLPAFYRRLFESGAIAEAVRAGRQRLLEQPGRVCARGTFPLDDALVPVLYQQDPLAFDFARQARPAEKPASVLPEEVRDGRDPYGFVGRDGPILQLERALHRSPPGLLIQGMGGQGKTALAKAFLRWLEQTGGLGAGAFWFSFETCRNAEAFFNRLGERLFGPDFGRAGIEERLRGLVEACRAHRLLLVWENFESVRGVPGTGVAGLLSEGDAGLLSRFLSDLRGGQSKVLITSRSTEDWLERTSRFVLELDGLGGEERWELASIILRDLGRQPDRKDPHLVELMNLLRGHPLALRVVLPRLERQNARTLVTALQSNFQALRLNLKDESETRLFATLKLATDALPPAWRPLLEGLSLHEGFVDSDYLEQMARQADPGSTRQTVEEFLEAMAVGGLLRDHGQAVFEMHPALAGFLRMTLTAEGTRREAWRRAFVDVMGSVADHYAPLQAHQQRGVVYWHQANFQSARRAGLEMGMHASYGALTQALAVFAGNRRDFRTARELYLALTDHDQQRGDEARAASTYHQLGMVAQEQRDFATAREWYLKSLAIKEKHGNEHGAAITYHHLGRVAEEERDFAAARDWYLKSLTIKEKHGNEHGAASTYGQLGILAALEGRFPEAAAWLLRTIKGFAKTNDPHAVRQSANNYQILYREASEADRPHLRQLWIAAGHDPAFLDENT
jgi:tetratricopeptide (TPR) repeat protein